MWLPQPKNAYDIKISHQWRDGRCVCENCRVRSGGRFTTGTGPDLSTLRVKYQWDGHVSTYSVYLCSPCTVKAVARLRGVET